MTRDALLLGVDVGGTTTAAGAVTREGAVLVEQRVLTHRDGKGRAPETIIELLGSVREQAERRGHRSEEHTSELQSRLHLVCRLLLEKKKNQREKKQNATSHS